MITFETLSQLIKAIQEFYLENDTNIGSYLLLSLGKPALEYKVTIVSDSSIFNNKPTALELILVEGSQKDYDSLKQFANQIHTPITPITTIGVGKLKTVHGGTITNSTEQFISRGFQRQYSVSMFGNTENQNSTTSSSASTSDTKGAVIKKQSESADDAKEEVIKKQNEVFSAAYILRNNKSLEAIDCTFNEELIIHANLTLTRVKAMQEVRSRKGSIEATDSHFCDQLAAFAPNASISLKNSFAQTVSSKGRIIWINEQVREEVVQEIECINGPIDLKGIKANKVIAAKTLKAEHSKLTSVKANTSVSLTKTQAGTVELVLPAIPVCYVILDGSSIEELIITDDPDVILGQKNGASHSVSLIPPSFNYPKKSFLGNLSEDASGRIEGQPYQYVADEYKPGVKVNIKGSGTINKITYVNCIAHSVTVSDTVTIESQSKKTYDNDDSPDNSTMFNPR